MKETKMVLLRTLMISFIKLDGKKLSDGADYRYGYESTTSGKDLVIWLNKTIDLNEREDHDARISINPVGK